MNPCVIGFVRVTPLSLFMDVVWLRPGWAQIMAIYLFNLFFFFTLRVFTREEILVRIHKTNKTHCLTLLRRPVENKYSNMRCHSCTIILNNMLTFDFCEKFLNHRWYYINTVVLFYKSSWITLENKNMYIYDEGNYYDVPTHDINYFLSPKTHETNSIVFFECLNGLFLNVL